MANQSLVVINHATVKNYINWS